MADVYEDEVSGNAVVLPVITPITYAPIPVGFTTATNVNFNARRVGECLHITGRFATGAAQAVVGQLPLPAGLTIGSWNGASTTIIAGKWTRMIASASAVKQGTVIAVTGRTYLTFSLDDYTAAVNPFTDANGQDVASGGVVVSFDGEVIVPIAEWAGQSMVAYGAGLATSVKAGLTPAMTPQTALTITSSLSGWTVQRAQGVAYSDSNGTWRLKFNIQGTNTTGSTVNEITFSGVTFRAGLDQCVSVQGIGTSPFLGSGAAVSNLGRMDLFAATSSTVWRVSGDVELASKPTWA